MRVIDLIPTEGKSLTIATNRKAAALLAVIFPLIPITFLGIALIKDHFRLGNILSHTVIVPLPIGLFAMYFWINRYWKPAFSALNARRPAIFLDKNVLCFFGAEREIYKSLNIYVQKGSVILSDAASIISTKPILFVKSKLLGINVHNL